MSGSRGAVNSSIFPDSRVTSMWDQNAVSSNWFSQHVTEQPGPTWDYYLLFPARARWGAVPGPIVSQGGPVIADGGQLLSAIHPLLGYATARDHNRNIAAPGGPALPGRRAH